MIISFITTYWADILLSLITAGTLAFCRYLWKELKTYRSMLEEQDQKETIRVVSEQIKPIYEKLDQLSKRIDEYDEEHKYQIEVIVESYKYRLITLCKAYLERGHISPESLEQLTKFFQVYESLSEEGEIKEAKVYYEKALQLPIIEEKDA